VVLDQSGRDAVLSVQDHGPGVAAEDADRVFHRYECSRHADRGVGGLGLGLYISRQIVEAHGGSLALEPSTQGALFIVRLLSRGP
jgi:signal transduction histidine kinase